MRADAISVRSVTTPLSSLRSASYQAALQRLERFARDVTAPILLEGESGIGKTMLARRIHEMSPLARAPFQHIVLSTLDDGVASSELFGHVPGAFTDARHPRAGHFASANGGTLFLDEIGKATRSLQAKLLHAIEYGEIKPVGSDRDIKVHVRIVAATNVDLAELVDRNEFLADLRARLASFAIRLPALRERRADIPALVREAVERHAGACGYETAPIISDELLDALRAAPWPNNLRELDATMHRLLLEADGAPTITLGHCVDGLSYLSTGRPQSREITRAQIDEALQKAGSVSGAARLLGIDRKTLRLKRRAD
jgi:two-component system, NtrC family, response regulator